MGDWLDDWANDPNGVPVDGDWDYTSDQEYIDYLIKQYKTINDKEKREKISEELYKYYGIIVETESILTEKTKIQDGSKLTELESISKEKTTRSEKNCEIESKVESKNRIENGGNGLKYHKDSILNHLNLSSDNFIMRYIETMSMMTSAYPEWHFAMATSMLSIISNRRVRMSLQHKVVYPNIWFFMLGLSTISQKTTAMRLGRELIGKLKKDELILRKLSGSFSPEGFLDDLQEHPNGYIWKDEAGDLLQSMKKEYMSNMRDIFCDVYESDYVTRRLKKSHIMINNVFVNLVLATTPDTFKAYTQYLDLTSGWLFRFLYLHAEYDKTRNPLSERTDEQNSKIEELVRILATKIEFVTKLKIGTLVVFGDGALDIYKQWSNKMQDRADKNKIDAEAAFIGRLDDYVLKLAILFTLGESEIKVEISKEIMTTSCSLAENYFLPLSMNIVDMVRTNESVNKMDKILGVIKRSGGKISRSVLIKNTHIKSRELDELCSTLIEGNEIKVDSRNKTIYYELVVEE